MGLVQSRMAGRQIRTTIRRIHADWHGAAQRSSISAAARLPNLLSCTSRARSSSRRHLRVLVTLFAPLWLTSPMRDYATLTSNPVRHRLKQQ